MKPGDTAQHLGGAPSEAPNQSDGNGRPHKFAAKSPEARARQLGNLTPQAPLRHGAYSPARLKPERERVLDELSRAFGSVPHDRLELLAAQRARITLVTDYLDEVGVVRHRGHGTVYPAVAMLQREEAAYRAELSKVEELARERRPYEALAELEDGRDG